MWFILKGIWTNCCMTSWLAGSDVQSSDEVFTQLLNDCIDIQHTIIYRQELLVHPQNNLILFTWFPLSLSGAPLWAAPSVLSAGHRDRIERIAACTTKEAKKKGGKGANDLALCAPFHFIPNGVLKARAENRKSQQLSPRRESKWISMTDKDARSPGAMRSIYMTTTQWPFETDTGPLLWRAGAARNTCKQRVLKWSKDTLGRGTPTPISPYNWRTFEWLR